MVIAPHRRHRNRAGLALLVTPRFLAIARPPVARMVAQLRHCLIRGGHVCVQRSPDGWPCEDPAGLAARRERGKGRAVQNRRMLYYSIAIIVVAVLAVLLVAT